MKRDEAVDRALAMYPDRAGVGRLCQELLSDALERPITWQAPSDLVRFNQFGGRRRTAPETS